MLEITEVIADFKALPEWQFLAKYCTPVLLHRTNRGETTGEMGFVSGLERVSRGQTSAVDAELLIFTARSASGLLVLPVRARPGHHDPQGRLSLGRTPDNDIRLPYDTVSKHHAYLSSTEGGDKWFVTDAGATNGTFLNGERLAPETPTPIPSGSVLKLATAELSFQQPIEFYSYLRRLLERARQR